MKLLLSLLLIVITIFAGHSYVAPESALDTVLETYESSLTHPVLTLQYGDTLPLSQRGRLANIPKSYMRVKTLTPDTLYYSIHLQATKKTDVDWKKIRVLQKKISHALHIRDSDWKISLQGEVDANAQYSIGETMEQIDVYQDNNSTISSYMTGLLPRYKQLNFNLQIAEHRLTSTQKKRITIGYPTLVVEI